MGAGNIEIRACFGMAESLMYQLEGFFFFYVLFLDHKTNPIRPVSRISLNIHEEYRNPEIAFLLSLSLLIVTAVSS